MQLYNYVRISCFTLIVDLFSKKSVKKNFVIVKIIETITKS